MSKFLFKTNLDPYSKRNFTKPSFSEYHKYIVNYQI